MDALTDSSGTTGGELNDFIDLPRKTGKMHPMARGKRKRGPDMTQRQQTIEVSVEKYDPDQPRDDHGRFGSGGSGGPRPAPLATARNPPDPQLSSRIRVKAKMAVKSMERAESGVREALNVVRNPDNASRNKVTPRIDAVLDEVDGAIRSKVEGAVYLKAVADDLRKLRADSERVLPPEVHEPDERDTFAVQTTMDAIASKLEDVAELIGKVKDRNSRAIDFRDSIDARSAQIRAKRERTMKSIEVEVVTKYDPDQPRDDHGRFGSGGGSTGTKSPASSDLLHSKDVPLNDRGKARQEEVAQRLAGRFGAVNPEKNYRIGTPTLKQALSDAFGEGAAWGGVGNRVARQSEVEEAIRNTGSSEKEKEIRALATAINSLDTGHRDEIVREVYREHLEPRGRLDKVREVVVSGAKIRDALKAAYAEGARATEVVQQWVSIHPNLKDW